MQMLSSTDSDYVACPDTHRSISRFCFSLGLGMVFWSSCQQKHITLSTCEAKYVAASEATQQLIWLHHLLTGLDFHQPTAAPLLCDNNGAINISTNSTFHTKLKHIDTKYKFLQECVSDSQLYLHQVPSKDNIANVFTKALPYGPFTCFHMHMGLQDSMQGGVTLQEE